MEQLSVLAAVVGQYAALLAAIASIWLCVAVIRMPAGGGVAPKHKLLAWLTLVLVAAAVALWTVFFLFFPAMPGG